MAKIEMREVTGTDVQAMRDAGHKMHLVDVRERDEWNQYHIPDVLLLPLSEFAARCRAELHPDEPIVCICEHGIRSAHAAEYLSSLGYVDVATMTGGMAEYPGPVESKAP